MTEGLDVAEQMTGLERVRAALDFGEPDRVPVYPLMHFASAKVIGIKIKEYATSAERMAESLIAAYRRYGYDGVHPGSDVSIEGEAVGSKLRQPEDATAFLVEPILQDPSDLDKLKVPDPHKDGRMPVIVNATKICSERIGKEAFITPGMMGPWNCASQIRGVEQLMFDMYDRPDFVRKLLDFVEELLFEYGKALIDAGAMMVLLGEALCSPNFISPKQYRGIIVPYQKRIVKKLMDYGVKYTLMHICGNIHPIMEDIASTGCKVVDIDWQVDIRKMTKQLDRKAAARGNLNPSGSLLMGTPEDVMRESRKVIEEAAGWRGLILGSGCDIARDTPAENLSAMVEASKKYGRY